jgi:hypothetical protein
MGRTAITLNKALNGASVVCSVMIDRGGRIAIEGLNQLPPHRLFARLVVSPKTLMSKAVTISDQESREIVESLVGYPFKVQKQFYARPIKTL